MFSLFPLETASAQLLQTEAVQQGKPGLCNSENATKRTRARDKSSSLLCPPDHTAPCHRVSPPSEKGHTGVFQGAALSSAWAGGAALGARSSNAAALSSSREKQSRYPCIPTDNWALLEKHLCTPINTPCLFLAPKATEAMKLPLPFFFIYFRIHECREQMFLNSSCAASISGPQILGFGFPLNSPCKRLAIWHSTGTKENDWCG